MSWEQLQDVYRINRDEARNEAGLPPDVCPVDGALLQVNAKGFRSCPLGNYIWNGGSVVLPVP